MNNRFVPALFAALALLAGAGFLAAQQEGHSSASPAAASPDYNRKWVDNTSGPIYTGTADVMPGGSFYLEPYYFNYRTRGSTDTTVPLKFAYGVGHHIELDAFTALEYVGSGGIDGTSFQYGDTMPQVKVQFAKQRDRYHFWRLPSIGFSVDVNIPTGHLQSAKPNVAGGTQTTNDTWNEQFNLLIRKQFKPFQLYLEGTEIVQNPVNVVGPYQFNNGITNIPAGAPFHVVDGNVLAASGALEHVLKASTGLGYLIEINGERQSSRSLFWGKATAPAFSYINVSPEIEYTWPAKGRFPLTWGGGVSINAQRSDYPRQLIPMFTVTFNGDLHGGR
ncbi:MAG: hypothetical protein ACLGSD_00990 [Acidobacteriota bacterium]